MMLAEPWLTVARILVLLGAGYGMLRIFGALVARPLSEALLKRGHVKWAFRVRRWAR
ncbi:MAG TPA: hypothetical protein VL588_01870 [Bdellovibrionota bacterium]|jgi:hypothetical protein|nr:hypothetical protein [Bdellovibrionota bacterium]